ncbi:MAG: pilus assembly PilX N-terminal domain-containing protein [Candidatus Acidiferrales bacterium]
MKTPRHSRRKQSESGIALLIAIFALMLISAVAISLIVASGSESSLAGNYRSSTSAYYAAFAGLEEGRGRLVPSNPNPINLPTPYVPVGTVQYIVNPAPGELGGLALLGTYPDTEYNQEFNAAPLVTLPPINSVWPVGGNPGPLYKWVRINAATEQSLRINVNGGGLDNTTPLYYDAALTPPSLVVPPVLAPGVPNPPATARQALEVTALAVLPNGSQKMVQYVIADETYALNFPSALTLAGQVGAFNGANSNPYHINGQDGSGNPPAVAGCVPNPANSLPAVGVTDPAGSTTNKTTVINGLPRPDHYTGGTPPVGPPSVSDVTLNQNLATPAGLADLLAKVQQNADAVIPNPPNPPNYNNSGTTYNFGGPGWPTNMSATNPKVVYVDGSFDMGPNVGYGILVVTGNFLYHGNSGWKGIILVVGDGATTYVGQGGGNEEFDGAVYIATIRNPDGSLRTPAQGLGTVNYNISGGGGNGVYYNSCWINKVQQPPKKLLLSFREISQ